MARGGDVGGGVVVVEDGAKCVLQMRDAVLICLDHGAQVLRSISSHVLSDFGRALSPDTNATTKVSLDW